MSLRRSTRERVTMNLVEYFDLKLHQIPYVSRVGSLMRAQVCTHLNIAYIVVMLGRFLNNTGVDHWIATKRVMRYIQRTKDYMLTYRMSES
ncbi:hypothetical protein V6Z12_A11G275200 [Gossypium hirsutum]